MSVAPSPARRRASMVASPTPSSPGNSHIPRPQSAAGRYRIASVASSSEAHSGASGNDQDAAEKGQVRVVLRIRPSKPIDPAIAQRHRDVLVHPTSQTDVRVSCDPSVLAGSGSVASTTKRHPSFTFDRVLPEEATQVDLYNATGRDRVEDFLRGFNVTFLAYGQTSSGKSYSMGTTGEDEDYTDLSELSRAGLIPRAVETVFRRAEEIRQTSGPGASWEARVSFLELYNEDMIDLLSTTAMPVSIREDKDGRIVWSGVREIKVTNLAEVMRLLHEGSARRRTGETNMNATSSRSHAIFSLTLTQARRADATEELRAPNTSKRPMSVMAMSGGGNGSRSTTPVFYRGAPPTAFASKLGRPSSMHVSAFKEDDMVTLTSKLNLVDLAGSERLKRTAAHGERMREGISINSGLLALGNVISALAEPSKSRGHIPYRDSKLTRLLQDSIGGNAVTTMIACVSPLEYNISETINTINYASRARRIKNAVSKNQTEVGWDDIDYLRNTVSKLRTKIAELETEPRSTSTPRSNHNSISETDDDVVREDDNNNAALQNQIIDLSDKLADLEDEFSHLQDQYFQKCREIVALSDPEHLEDDKLRQFNETIEPVVLEYEKVVTSLNGQLAELRAENAAQLQSIEEKDSDISQKHRRIGEHESYAQELQGRLAKLSQRNESSEAYIRDLETKFRTFTETDERRSGVISGLTAEIQLLKSDSVKSNSYIAQLEARIATSETRNHELADLVERYEHEAETREKQFQDLEQRLTMLDKDHNVDALIEELEQKDRRIEDLEHRLHQDNVAFEAAKTPSTPPETPPVLRTIVEEHEADEKPEGASEPQPAESPEVERLRKENEALLRRLRESEQRFERTSTPPSGLETTSEHDEEFVDAYDSSEHSHNRMSTTESSESDTTLETPKHASRTVSPQINDEFGGPRSPQGVFRASEFRNSLYRTGGEPHLLRPLSLSQGLSTLTYGNTSPRYSWSSPPNGPLAYERSPKFERAPKRQSMPFDAKPFRSVQSLEIDLSLLQKAVTDREAQLRQREAEIQYLKKTLAQATNVKNSAAQLNHDEVIDRLRQDHADEVEKIYNEHDRAMKALADEHTNTITTLRSEVENAKSDHAAKILQLEQTHKTNLEEMQSRHHTELQESTEMKSALDAAWEELAATSRRHQTERDNLTSSHHAEIAELDQRHADVLDALQKEITATSESLKNVREELAAANDAKAQVEKALAERPDVSNMVEQDEHNMVVAAMEEMEKALTAAEDEKRQLKMKTDQVRFELSRIRDEAEVQRSADLNRMSELEKRLSSLSAETAELKQVNEQLSRNRDSKVSILDARTSRVKLPPIGPPPTAPLPPLPAGREAVISPALTNGSLPRTSHHEGSLESARSSRYESVDGHAATASDSAHTVSERDDVMAAVNEAKEKVSELESKLQTELRNNEAFTKDLIELRKNNSKLKVRVDDVNRELTELKRERDGLRREVVEMKNELADAQYDKIADRQRLERTKAEAAQYKAKLDRIVDAKVTKNQKLKCF